MTLLSSNCSQRFTNNKSPSNFLFFYVFQGIPCILCHSSKKPVTTLLVDICFETFSLYKVRTRVKANVSHSCSKKTHLKMGWNKLLSTFSNCLINAFFWPECFSNASKMSKANMGRYQVKPWKQASLHAAQCIWKVAHLFFNKEFENEINAYFLMLSDEQALYLKHTDLVTFDKKTCIRGPQIHSTVCLPKIHIGHGNKTHLKTYSFSSSSWLSINWALENSV